MTSKSAGFGWDDCIILSAKSNYSYDGDKLLEPLLNENYDGYVTRRTHTCTSSTSYDFIREKFDFIGIYEIRNLEADIIFNVNGVLIEYHQKNIEDGERRYYNLPIRKWQFN